MQQRIFITVPVPSTPGEMLLAAAKRAHLKFIHWTPVVNLHLTLAFLGPLDDSRIEQVKNILDNICSVEAFELEIEKVSRFPDNHGHILAALPSPSSQLDALHKTVVQLLSNNGFQLPDQPFKPHITLGRFSKQHRGQDDIDLNLSEGIHFKVRSICLYQSVQSDTGVAYITKAQRTLSACQNSF